MTFSSFPSGPGPTSQVTDGICDKRERLDFGPRPVPPRRVVLQVPRHKRNNPCPEEETPTPVPGRDHRTANRPLPWIRVNHQKIPSTTFTTIDVVGVSPSPVPPIPSLLLIPSTWHVWPTTRVHSTKNPWKTTLTPLQRPLVSGRSRTLELHKTMRLRCRHPTPLHLFPTTYLGPGPRRSLVLRGTPGPRVNW